MVKMQTLAEMRSWLSPPVDGGGIAVAPTCTARRPWLTSTALASPNFHDLKLSNRLVQICTPGGVAGARSKGCPSMPISAIVTHNIKNFRRSPELNVQAITPAKFLTILRSKS
jgi:hypothetical protein